MTTCENDPECSDGDEDGMDQLKQAHQDPYVEVEDGSIERRAAYQALDDLLSGSGSSLTAKSGKADSDDRARLPFQAAYAGSHAGRHVRYGVLSNENAARIPPKLLKLFNLDLDNTDSTTPEILGRPRQRLFLHQALAIDSAMSNVHTVVTTATGSGKSMCFLLPILANAMLSLQQGETPSSGSAAILLFPTKSLAQDQFSKIVKLLQPLANSDSHFTPLRAGVIDGDTPHSKRDEIAISCQIILTNPDTLHAALLPNWKKNCHYQKLLARVSTVVVDEAHVYEGAFGAHVAMVLRRLSRVCRLASSPSNTGNATPAKLSFIACSATVLYPEEFFRILCPIGKDEKVCVLTSKDDGSPSPPKHFFVWNPPILDVNGN
jgi:DEAD/DEAH box helicase domain-containing protein